MSLTIMQSARTKVLAARLSGRPTITMRDGPIVRQERLGGLLNYYYRKAA